MIVKNTLFKRGFAASASAICLIGASALSARADVKIVSTSTVTGLPAQALAAAPDAGKPQTITTYLKGDKQRTDTVAGKTTSVSIYDGAKDELYTLDAAKKTYYVTKIGDVLTTAGGLTDNPLMDMLRFETKAAVDPGTGKKIIAGKEARNFIYSATIKISMDASADPSLAQAANYMPTVEMTGEQWTTDAVPFPANFAKLRATNMTKAMPPLMQKGIKELTDKMAIITGLPLSSRVTVNVKLPAAAAGLPGAPSGPITTTNEVTEVSDTPLADDLFAVPSGYKKVAAPRPDAVGGSAPGGAV